MIRKDFILIPRVIVKSSAIIGARKALDLANLFAEEIKLQNPRFMANMFVDYIRERLFNETYKDSFLEFSEED
jgi:hypothetical protein